MSQSAWVTFGFDEEFPALRHDPLLHCIISLSYSIISPLNRFTKVAYLGPSRRLVEGCDKKWGVRAAENIAVGTFICTVAGQVRPPSSLFKSKGITLY